MRPEALLAAGAAAVGAISIASGLTPSLASHNRLVVAVLPPGVPSAARIAVIAFGLALIWLSRALARRQRRAWLLAAVLVTGTAAAHLAKGLDAEEAAAAGALCLALLRYRARFDVAGDPAANRPLAVTLLALGSLAALTALVELSGLSAPDGGAEMLWAATLLLGARAVHLLLRPWTERMQASVAERGRAREIIRRYGSDSLAFFALRRDKSYFFSASGRAFLAYRVVGGSALVSGDPVGEPAEFSGLLQEFGRLARARGWRLAILGVGDRSLPLYRSLGFRAVKLGDEAVVRPVDFSLEGRRIRKVRQSVSRLERAGFTVRLLRTADADASLRAELASVSAEWLGSWPERGFTMAMDNVFGEPDTVLAVAETADGRVGGFLHFVPTPAAHGYSLSAMRRRRATPNGLIEFLVAQSILAARDRGVAQISLNFCVFAELLRPGGCDSRAGRALAFALLRLDHIFQLHRLLAFSAKFSPEWHSRYICLERLADFPRIGLAYLQVESLLTPPGPWVRRRARRVQHARRAAASGTSRHPA